MYQDIYYHRGIYNLAMILCIVLKLWSRLFDFAWPDFAIGNMNFQFPQLFMFNDVNLIGPDRSGSSWDSELTPATS